MNTQRSRDAKNRLTLFTFFIVMLASSLPKPLLAEDMPRCIQKADVFWNNCRGTLDFGDGSYFNGEFKNDKRHGQGELWVGDKKIIDGVWANGTSVTVASNAWTEVATSADSFHFIDPKSRRQTGGSARAWFFVALSKKNSTGAWSYRELMEFDCPKERYRSLTIHEFSEPMLSGPILNAVNSASDWYYIAPGSIGEGKMKAACSK